MTKRLRIPFRILVLVVLVISVCSSCGNFNRTTPPADFVGEPAPEQVQLKAFTDKSLELSRHAVVQLAHSYRTLDLIFNFRVGDRILMNDDSKPLSFGCRHLRKESPAYERAHDTNVEELEFTFYKCEPETSLDPLLSDASLSGSQSITIVYDKPYPRSTNPDLKLGFPLFIDSRAAAIEVSISIGTRSRIQVRRDEHLSARKMEESDESLTYMVTSTVTDTFKQVAGSTTLREGTVTVKTRELMITVTKGETRRISEIKLKGIDIEIKGKAKEPFDLSFRLEPTSQLRAPDSVCAPASGTYQLTQNSSSAIDVAVSSDTITLQGFDPSPVRICGQPDETFYIDEFANAYR